MTSLERYVSSFIVCLTCLFSQVNANEEQEYLSIVYAANMPIIDPPEHGDYAELASALADQRQRSPSSFFLFGGNSLGPSPLSAFDRGSHIIDILNTLEPDAMNVTKREFIYFEDELSLRSYEAAFPIVSSNLYDPVSAANLDGIASSAIIQRGSHKIGIVSLIDHTAVEDYLLQRVMITAPEQAIQTESKDLRQQGADIIVLMLSTHYDFVNKLIEDGTVNLSLQTDPFYDDSPYAQDKQLPQKIIVKEHNQVTFIDLSWPTNQLEKLKVEHRSVPLTDYKPDPEVSELISSYKGTLDRLLSEKLGSTATKLTTEHVKVRTQETAFGNFLADSLRHYAGSDIGFINGGVIRGNTVYAAGSELSRREIAEELPFRSRLAVIEIYGQQIIDALENGLSQIEKVNGRFPQVSGIKVSYDPKKPPFGRLISVSKNGKPIVPTEVYTLATSRYVVDGGDGYNMFAGNRKTKLRLQLTPLISDVVIDRIRQLHVISPTLESRMVDVNEQQ